MAHNGPGDLPAAGDDVAGLLLAAQRLLDARDPDDPTTQRLRRRYVAAANAARHSDDAGRRALGGLLAELRAPA